MTTRQRFFHLLARARKYRWYVGLLLAGHVEKFADLMVKDSVTGEPYRADKLLEDLIDDLLEKNPDMPQASVVRGRDGVPCGGS